MNMEHPVIYITIVNCLFIFLGFIIKVYFHMKRWLWKRKFKELISVGFFHPYCNAGGGGERVLWCAIRAVQNKYKNVHCVIYTGDQASGSEILQKAENTFNIKLPRPVEFVHLKRRNLIEAKNYPYFTLLLQSLASLVLGLEAAFKFVPDIYIDTMGYAFTYPIFKYLSACRIGAYVHYPTISCDMLLSVSEQQVAVNNREFISKSKLLSSLKLCYYRWFSLFYSLTGGRSEVIMANSTWTQNHILTLWGKPNSTFIVYPPCDVSAFEKLPLRDNLNKRDFRIVSVAQFRPEKNHELQLNSLKQFFDIIPHIKKFVKLILIGSCRHEEDINRVKKLKDLSCELGVEKNVEFKMNLSFEEIVLEMKNADVALHSMWNEHFGIGIVECMSAGLITIANDSGGPKLDIVQHRTNGFLASDTETYAVTLLVVWKMDSSEIYNMRKAARKSSARFSEKKFEKSFLNAIQILFT